MHITIVNCIFVIYFKKRGQVKDKSKIKWNDGLFVQNVLSDDHRESCCHDVIGMETLSGPSSSAVTLSEIQDLVTTSKHLVCDL